MNGGFGTFLAVLNTTAQLVLILVTWFIWGMSGSDEFAGFITVSRFSLTLMIAALVSGLAGWPMALGGKSRVWKWLFVLPFAVIGIGILLSIPELMRDASQEFERDGISSFFG